MHIEVQGSVEHITYINEENGFAIAKLKVKGHRKLVTITGAISSVRPGEILKVKGWWSAHPKFGDQIRVDAYEAVAPAAAAGLEKYLGSGLVKGIGPKRAELIASAWTRQQDINELAVFLQEHDVSPTYAPKIFGHYGKNAVGIIRKDPYRLALDISGIGFHTADRVAGRMGIGSSSVVRAGAGIIYTLHQCADNGHACCSYDHLVAECTKVLSAGTAAEDTAAVRDVIGRGLGELAAGGYIAIENVVDNETGDAGPWIFLAKFHAAETGIARSISRILGTRIPAERRAMADAVALAQKELGIVLSNDQARAVREVLDHKVVVITGDPGTGKTTVVKAIIQVFNRMGRRALLAAPTGRAAKRLAEAAGQEARTIHRLLEFCPRENAFMRDGHNPLDADLVVIDETSMVDSILMHHLLKAVPTHASLILVGDADQLPAVGAGDVLRDITASGMVPTVRLTEVLRQSGKSHIVCNAGRINRGEMPDLAFGADEPRDFYFLKVERPESILQRVVYLCKDLIPRKFGYSPIRDIQVITAMHRGVIGVMSLNGAIQKALNPQAGGLMHEGVTFRKGDKVMQLVNDYDKDVFNGDIGIVAGIDETQGELIVDFDGHEVIYAGGSLDEIVLAYAISVHKSQGSEYPVVVMPIHEQQRMLLQRNLLYTGITRGRELVVLVGTGDAVGIAVRNREPHVRHTRLKERLRELKQVP